MEINGFRRMSHGLNNLLERKEGKGTIGDRMIGEVKG